MQGDHTFFYQEHKVVKPNKILIMLKTKDAVHDKCIHLKDHQFSELGLLDGHEIHVADPTSPNSLTFRLQLASKMDD